MAETPAVIEYLGLALAEPRRFTRIIAAERRSMKYGFMIVLVSSIVLGVSTGYTLAAKAIGAFAIPLTGIAFLRSLPAVVAIAMIAASVIAFVIAWLIIGFIIYGFSRILNGRGGFENTLLATSLLWLPSFIHGLVTPVYVLADYLVAVMAFILVVIVGFILGLVLSVQALSEVHGYGVGKALLSIILPAALIVAILIAIPLTIASIT